MNTCQLSCGSSTTEEPVPCPQEMNDRCRWRLSPKGDPIVFFPMAGYFCTTWDFSCNADNTVCTADCQLIENDEAPEEEEKKHMSAGLIVAIVIACIIVSVVLFSIAYSLYDSYRKSKEVKVLPVAAAPLPPQIVVNVPNAETLYRQRLLDLFPNIDYPTQNVINGLVLDARK